MTRAVGNWDFTADWSASGGQLVFKRTSSTNRIDWGEDTKGFISRWYGETTSAYMEWAASGDELLILKGEGRIASASFSGGIVVTGEADITSASITNAAISGEADITSASVTTLTTVSLSVTGPANIASASFSGNIVHAGSTTVTFGAGANMVLSSVSGTIIGTSSTQKLGFLGAAPIVAEKFSISAADIASAMKNFGLFTTTSA